MLLNPNNLKAYIDTQKDEIYPRASWVTSCMFFFFDGVLSKMFW